MSLNEDKSTGKLPIETQFSFLQSRPTSLNEIVNAFVQNKILQFNNVSRCYDSTHAWPMRKNRRREVKKFGKLDIKKSFKK